MINGTTYVCVSSHDVVAELRIAEPNTQIIRVTIIATYKKCSITNIISVKYLLFVNKGSII